jgi:DNA-binding CsgD family transcriptional regulator
MDGYNAADARGIEGELRKIWGRIPSNLNIRNDNFDVNTYKTLLDIFQVGKYYYMIFNVKQSFYDIISPEIKEVLGYGSHEVNFSFFMALVHPDDAPYLLNFENAIEHFFKGLEPHMMFKYKVQYDCRLRRADGTYARILNQTVVLQHDDDAMRTFVINTDISHLKHDPHPKLSFLGLEGTPSFYNVAVENVLNARPLFTKREKDILKAMAAGMRSKQISEMLNISKLTVDSHRKNMMKKTHAKSAGEVISMAYDNGWI